MDSKRNNYIEPNATLAPADTPRPKQSPNKPYLGARGCMAGGGFLNPYTLYQLQQNPKTFINGALKLLWMRWALRNKSAMIFHSPEASFQQGSKGFSVAYLLERDGMVQYSTV